MAQLLFDLSGKEGLAPKFFGDRSNSTSNPERRIIGGDTQMAEGSYNPFTLYGYMSPATSFTKAITVTGVGTCTASVYDEINQDIYFVENGTKIFKLASNDATSTSDAETIATAAFTDVEIYQVNGVRKLFYTYIVSGVGEMGIAALPYATSDTNWLSTVPTGMFALGGTNHRLVKADNGFLYILDGSTVHKIDGTTNGGSTGIATSNVLIFPPYFTLWDAVDTRGQMHIAVQSRNPITAASESVSYSGSCGVYIWDRLSSTVNFRDYIPVIGARTIHKVYVAPNGNIRIMVTSSNRTMQIMEFDGTRYNVIAEAGLSAYPVYPKSVHVTSDIVYWLGKDGKFYAHGAVSFGEKEGIFILGSFSAATPGAIMYAGNASILTSPSTGQRSDPEAFYITYASGGVTVMKQYLPFASTNTGGSWTQTNDAGNVFTLVKSLPEFSTAKDLYIYMLPSIDPEGVSSDIAQIKIFFNQSTTAWATKTVTNVHSFAGYVHFEINKPFVNAVQLEIIYKTDRGIGVTNFFPYVAVLDYETTSAI